MNHMAAKITKYLRLFLLFTKINYLRAMEYRIDFLSGIITPLCYSLGYLTFIKVILSQTPQIASWDFNGMLLLFATSQLLYYGAWLLYRNSLDDFSDSVRDGSFDLLAKLPVLLLKRPGGKDFWAISFPFPLAFALFSSDNLV